MKKYWIVGTLIALPILVLAAIFLWFVADTADRKTSAARNVAILGVDVSSMDRKEISDEVAKLAGEYGEVEVVIEAGGQNLETTAADLGFSLDEKATVEEALEVGRDGSTWSRFVDWLGSFSGTDDVAALYEQDPEGAKPELQKLAKSVKVNPQEPSFVVNPEGFGIEPGVDGKRVAIDQLAMRLVASAQAGDNPISAKATFKPIAPDVSDDQATFLAVKANQLTENGFDATAEGQTVNISPDVLRSWMAMRLEGDKAILTLDADAAEGKAAELLAGLNKPATPAGWAVEGGVPKFISPGGTPSVCCEKGAGKIIAEAIESGKTTAEVQLIKGKNPQNSKWAASQNIVEEIGTFTTFHAAGQGRVTNIQRIADIVRGVVVESGDSFSINDFVGPRTSEKGFVSGGVIIGGKHSEGIGGGISQFATTTFNAAFFSGLDILEYKMHSEYISRYPFGREATLHYPSVDLRIRNNTPNGVLIWTSYTPTSITVTFYGTKHAPGEQTNQTTGKSGACTTVKTERTRTFPDGRKEKDYFSGLYRPGDGIPC